MQGQTEKGEFDFSEDNGKMTGTISGDNITSGNNELERIVVDGNTVSFTYDMDDNGFSISFSFDLKIDGDTFEGTVTTNIADVGPFTISGKRISKPH